MSACLLCLVFGMVLSNTGRLLGDTAASRAEEIGRLVNPIAGPAERR